MLTDSAYLVNENKTIETLYLTVKLRRKGQVSFKIDQFKEVLSFLKTTQESE